MPEAVLRLMTIQDYPALFALWNSVPGFNRGLRSLDDSEAGITHCVVPALAAV